MSKVTEKKPFQVFFCSLGRWRWARVQAGLALLVAIGLWRAIYVSNSVTHFLMVSAVAAERLLLTLSFLSLVAGSRRSWLSNIARVVLVGLVAWYCASSELYHLHGRVFTVGEMIARLGEATGRRFVVAQLVSPRIVFLVSAVSVWLWLIGPLLIQRYRLGVIVVYSCFLITCVGVYFERWGPTERQGLWVYEDKPPWFTWNRGGFEGSLQLDRERVSTARYMQQKLSTTQEDDRCKGLLGRYRSRSLVMIVMESQRASNIAAYSPEINVKQQWSPGLTGHAARGVVFSNCWSGSLVTVSATWSFFTSLPENSKGYSCYNSPSTGDIGAIAALSKAGYRVAWIQATDSAYGNFDRLASSAGAAYWVTREEVEMAGGLGCWGLPDRELFRILRKRIEGRLVTANRPFFLGCVTVGNHAPYDMIDEDLPRSIEGGMRYADRCVGEFLDWILTLPEAIRPIVYVTGDTSQLARTRERSVRQRARVPALLLLPDSYLAGETYESLFAHEYSVPFLAELVGVETDMIGLIRRRPRATIHVMDDRSVVITDFGYLLGEKFFGFDGKRVVDVPLPLSLDLLKRYAEIVDDLWRPK